MDETKLVLNLKNVRKAAFAMGVGFTVGKYVGKCVNSAMDGLATGVLKGFADYGNNYAQKLCERCNIEYEKEERVEKPKENSDNVTMGFHA